MDITAIAPNVTGTTNDAAKRPVFGTQAYPVDLPAAGPSSPSGFVVDDVTLLYAGTIGVEGVSRSAVGWVPQMRRVVDGGFNDALAAARALAKEGADPAKYTPPDQSSITHLAAVIVGGDGLLHVAPVFIQSFDPVYRRSAHGTEMYPSDRFAPGQNTTVVALAGIDSWIDARPTSIDEGPEPTT